MNIEISTERLDADINKMQESMDSLRNANSQVFRCLENLRTMWDGMAQEVFYAQVRLDQAVTNDTLQSVQNLIECMQYAKTEYNRCNEDVNSKIASIRLSNDT